MRRALVAGLVLACAGSVRADDAADCQAIIKKAVEAMGGAENVKKFKASTWSEKGTFHGLGMAVPYTAKYAVQWPGQFKMDVEGFLSIAVNGDKGWKRNAGGAAEDMSPAEFAEQKESQFSGWIASLIPLAEGDKDLTLSPLGETKVGDRPAVGVKVSAKGHRDVKLWFDKETGLLVKSENRVKDQATGKEVDQEGTFSNYRNVNGLQVPGKIAVKQDGKPYLEAENFDVKVLEKLDPGVFAKP